MSLLFAEGGGGEYPPILGGEEGPLPVGALSQGGRKSEVFWVVEVDEVLGQMGDGHAVGAERPGYFVVGEEDRGDEGALLLYENNSRSLYNIRRRILPQNLLLERTLAPVHHSSTPLHYVLVRSSCPLSNIFENQNFQPTNTLIPTKNPPSPVILDVSRCSPARHRVQTTTFLHTETWTRPSWNEYDPIYSGPPPPLQITSQQTSSRRYIENGWCCEPAIAIHRANDTSSHSDTSRMLRAGPINRLTVDNC